MAKLPEGVYIRGEGGSIWIRYTIDGAQIRERTGLKVDQPNSIESARALRSKRIAEAFERKNFPGKHREAALGEVVDEYVAFVADRRDGAKMKKRLERALKFFGRNTPISTITHSKILRYQRELEAEPIRGGKKREPMTIVHFLVNLRSAFRRAVKARLTTTDPMIGFEIPKVQNARDRIATNEEIDLIVELAEEDVGHVILLAVETGMRRERIVNLDWAQVDTEARIIKLQEKTRRKPVPRRVPLSKRAISVLEKRGPRRSGLVFPGLKADKVSVDFGRHVREIGIQDLRFHDLRHTAFTRMHRAGVSLRTIQEISGHKRLEMLFRYQTVNDADLVAAVDSVERETE